MMARYTALHGTFDALRQTAKVMVLQPAHNIGQMQALLKADGATPLPPPQQQYPKTRVSPSAA
jgi:hypothetical protein